MHRDELLKLASFFNEHSDQSLTPFEVNYCLTTMLSIGFFPSFYIGNTLLVQSPFISTNSTLDNLLTHTLVWPEREQTSSRYCFQLEAIPQQDKASNINIEAQQRYQFLLQQ